jgi:hypothetical protein
VGKAFASNLYHSTLNPGAVDISHQLIKILVNWQIYSKNHGVVWRFWGNPLAK